MSGSNSWVLFGFLIGRGEEGCRRLYFDLGIDIVLLLLKLAELFAQTSDLLVKLLNIIVGNGHLCGCSELFECGNVPGETKEDTVAH